VILDIVEVPAADVMDVDQLPGGDCFGGDPDRDAEANDSLAASYVGERNLVAERYRLTRSDR
jgi:hypothetical protein